MKFNGTIFSKPQQDQLKEVIGKELEAVVEKVNDVDARMLNYTGDWVTDNEYHENDVVTWANDGHLYEVIKAHTSSSTIDPSNAEYYKAMTSRKYTKITFSTSGTLSKRDKEKLVEAIQTDPNAIVHAVYDGDEVILRPINNTSIYPRIGGVVYGITSSKMGFVQGAVVPTGAGNITFDVYSGTRSTDGVLTYESVELSLRDVVFLQ